MDIGRTMITNHLPRNRYRLAQFSFTGSSIVQQIHSLHQSVLSHEWTEELLQVNEMFLL